MIKIHPHEFDNRINRLIGMFEDAEYLDEDLPHPVGVYKGVWRPVMDNSAVFISRGGISTIDYDMGTQTAMIYQRCEVALQTKYATKPEDVETHCNVLAANAVAVLTLNVQALADWGWYTGFVVGSKAVRFRKSDQLAFEIEVLQYEIKFEVTYSEPLF